MLALVAGRVAACEVGQVVRSALSNLDEVVDLVGAELVAQIATAHVSLEDPRSHRLPSAA
jgi:hypothetical protein